VSYPLNLEEAMSHHPTSRLVIAAVAALSLHFHGAVQGQAAEANLADLARAGKVRAAHRQVTELVDGGRQGARLSAGESFDVAWIEGASFTAGTLELETRGKDVQGQSFLGVAFAGANDSTFETVYVRPFNYRTTDAARHAHAVQYESMPAHPWAKLRSDFPEVYENPVAPPPDPNGWVRLRLIVEPTRVRVFVGEGAEPDLVVARIGPGKGGRLGLWVGNGSGGDFANLRITPAAAGR
jgi:hypothetical protein